MQVVGKQQGERLWAQGPDVVYRPLAPGAGGVLLHLKTGAYHGLNATGAAIWTLLERPRTLADLAADVVASVKDAPSDLVAAITAFLEDLSARDLIEGPT